MPVSQSGPENELYLLEALENSPETTQADLAAQVGVAVGTVNWYLKRWSKKGYVKVSRIGRWRWHYLLTPRGISHKATLATKYVDASMTLYRRTRNDATRLLEQIRAQGYSQIYVDGDSEIAEICALTCLEMQIGKLNQPDDQYPTMTIDGVKLAIVWPQDGENVHG